jgi:hypothetical protein
MKWTAIISIFFLSATAFCKVCTAGNGCLKTNCIEESGVQKTERRSVGSFDSIEIKGTFSIIIDSGHDYALKITCDSNLLPYISTEVMSQKLFIYTKNSICTTKGIKIFVSSPDIRRVAASGSNDISIEGIDNHSMSVSLDGAGDLNLSGFTKKFEAELFGSNHLFAKNFRTEETSISIAGASDARVYASDVLKIDISGVGGVVYSGNPKTILKNISGIGTIKAAE